MATTIMKNKINYINIEKIAELFGSKFMEGHNLVIWKPIQTL